MTPDEQRGKKMNTDYRTQYEKETGEREPDGMEGLYSWVKYEQGYSRWLTSKLEKVEELYNELLYAVGRKFDGETRHQTALKYIRSAEELSNAVGSFATQSQEEER